MKLVLATKNADKLKELLTIANQELDFELILAPDHFDPIESGSTFLENAIIKAREAARLTGLPAVSDDSGLEVEALDGQPGIHSARYCDGSDQDRRQKLLAQLNSIPDAKRAATFVCAMALAAPSGEVLHSTLGRWKGSIGYVERGTNGFGYDSIFYLAEKNCTSAELSPEEKNRLSHRGQAWRLMLGHLGKNPSLLDNRPSYW
jgi:XTP/dITP diphosphohydrolase